MRESAIENLLVQYIRRMGGVALKLTPTTAGVPDRVVLMPYNRVYLVELKALDGVVSAVQKVWHDRSSNRGWPVRVVQGRKELTEFLEELQEEQDHLSRSQRLQNEDH